MIDWHSHILPKLDDGSQSIEESIQLLKMLCEQGIDTVIATPHFLANDQSVEDFLKFRNDSLESLKGQLTESMPKILCGAEVKYYPGISKLENIKSLCIEGTDLILIEMSMSKWTEYTVRELVELANKDKLKVIIAHMERYMSYQSDETICRLYDEGVLFQMNASFFLSFTTKRKALSMLSEGQIHVIGSDCHSVNGRPPLIGKAMDVISKKLGYEFTQELNEYGKFLLKL